MKNSKLLLFLVAILTLVFFYFRGAINIDNVKSEGVFTIFYIDKIVDGRGLPQIYFHYYYDGKKFNGKYPCSSVSLNETSGGKIFGKVIPYTDNYFTCCYCLAPENLEPPTNGWTNIPKEYCTKLEEKCL